MLYQFQAVGVIGLSGPPAPEPAVLNLRPAIGAAAVLTPKLEERSALDFRNCTMGLEFKSRDSPALSLFSVQVRCAESPDTPFVHPAAAVAAFTSCVTLTVSLPERLRLCV